MGRPLNKQQLFGANEKGNIKVQFYNGTASVRGYIVEQTGSKRFKCSDENGVTATCYLTSKPSAQLGAGEMSITILTDDDNAYQITKLTRHRVSYNGISKAWTFTANLSDGYVQMEEAGSDTQMTGAVDLEGDDFNTLTSYPVPGSGQFATSNMFGLPGYNAVGSPYEPTGSITTVTGYGNGLRRNKFLGNFCTTASSAPNTWNYNWFIDNSGSVVQGSEVFDTFGGFGYQQDLEDVDGGHNFSLESKGWIKAPYSQTYNFYGTSDDHMAIWIGDAAKTGYNNTNAAVIGHGGLINPVASITMDAGKWYPIRIWFSEFHGGCQSQFFAVGSNSGQQFSSVDFTFKYNPQGEGW